MNLQFSTNIVKNNNSYSSRKVIPLPQLNQYPNNIPRPQVNAQSLSKNTMNQIIKEDKPRKMKWGPPTWFALHTLAEKVKETAFPKVRRELIEMIFKICNNLPCPDCANHATRYMQSINVDTIQTKRHLKDMLYQFHNSVNSRKGYPMFSYEELNEKYALSNTSNILKNFMSNFEQNYSNRVNPNNFHRSRAIGTLKKWLTDNIQYFDQ